MSYADSYCKNAKNLEALGKPSEAIAEYQQALRLNPDHAEAYKSKSLLTNLLMKKIPINEHKSVPNLEDHKKQAPMNIEVRELDKKQVDGASDQFSVADIHLSSPIRSESEDLPQVVIPHQEQSKILIIEEIIAEQISLVNVEERAGGDTSHIASDEIPIESSITLNPSTTISRYELENQLEQFGQTDSIDGNIWARRSSTELDHTSLKHNSIQQLATTQPHNLPSISSIPQIIHDRFVPIPPQEHAALYELRANIRRKLSVADECTIILSQNDQDSIEDYKKAIALNVLNQNTHYALAKFLNELELYNEAMKYIDKAIALESYRENQITSISNFDLGLDISYSNIEDDYSVIGSLNIIKDTTQETHNHLIGATNDHNIEN